MTTQFTKAEAGYLARCQGGLPCFMCVCFDPHMQTCSKVVGCVLPLGSCSHASAKATAVIEIQEADPLAVPGWGGKNW